MKIIAVNAGGQLTYQIYIIEFILYAFHYIQY